MDKHRKDCAACAAHDPCAVYDGADFYDCDDGAERLSHSAEDDAISDFLDALDDPELDDLESLTVYAFGREAPPGPDWAKGIASHFVDDVEDAYAEQYGDPDGDSTHAHHLTTEERAELVRAVSLAVSVALAKKVPWSCEERAQRVFEGERLAKVIAEFRAANRSPSEENASTGATS